jgi:carbamoyltransferase
VTERSAFKRLFVPAAPSDDGNAVGAALLAHAEDHRAETAHTPSPRPSVASPYLGSTIDPKELAHFGHSARMLGRLELDRSAICGFVAAELARGKVVAWIQGRAEFGPRSLGNRSILADPRNPLMKERINSIVKFREGFRPFAPSVLDEFGEQYFEGYTFTPYMERTLRIRPEHRAKIPAVCHVDGTGRLQSVTKASNPRFHELISAFHQLTGVPVLLNTSLNVMGKPIVHSAADAFNIYLSSRIDILVIDDLVFSKAHDGSTSRQPIETAQSQVILTGMASGSADTLED